MARLGLMNSPAAFFAWRDQTSESEALPKRQSEQTNVPMMRALRRGIVSEKPAAVTAATADRHWLRRLKPSWVTLEV